MKVFGGDTKLNGGDLRPNIDDSLYLLNTTTRVWTIANVAGAKPSGRYGHTLNMLGPKVLVFGGQVEGFFFNDLVAFDLNTLTHAHPRWELINPVDGNEPPPSRTNHVAIAHNDKLYIFGGTNGVDWFNDIWRFDPVTRTWTKLQCSGFVPEPREGHSASLVGDVIYVFGGRDIDGNDLGDLSAFKISTSRWFTFQNMGIGPSPRSGHALCTVGKKIFVVGGEGVSSRADEQSISVLDTAKIKFPAETRPSHNANEPVANEIMSATIQTIHGSPTPRLLHPGMKVTNSSIRSVSGQSITSVSRLPHNRVQLQKPTNRERTPSQQGRRLSQLDELRGTIPRDTQLRGIGTVNQSQRTSSQPLPNKDRIQSMPDTTPVHKDLKRSGSLDSLMDHGDLKPSQIPARKAFNDVPDASDRSSRLGRVRSLEELRRDREHSIQAVIDSNQASIVSETDVAPALRHMDSGNIQALLQPKTEVTKDQHEDSVLSSKLNSAVNHSTGASSSPESSARLAWLEMELDLARKSGYTLTDTSYSLSVSSWNESNPESLIALRADLLKVEARLEDIQKDAKESTRIALAERDLALKEAAYEKALTSAFTSAEPALAENIVIQRNHDLEQRLLENANQYRICERQVFALQAEVASISQSHQTHDQLSKEHEKIASNAAQNYQELLEQHNSLRSSWVESQTSLHENQARRLEAEAALSNHRADSAKLEELEIRHAKHLEAFELAQAAATAASTRASAAEVSLEEERKTSATLACQVRDLSASLNSAKSQVEDYKVTVDQTTRALELTRIEAESARSAMVAGISSLVEYHKASGAHDPIRHQDDLERVKRELSDTRILHQQSREALEMYSNDTTQLNEKFQALTADNASLQRNILALRRDLAATQEELQKQQKQHASVEDKLAASQSDLATSVLKMNTLQQILSSRPNRADSLEKRRSRNLSSPGVVVDRRSQTPEASRLRELEQRLLESSQLQQEMYESHKKTTAEIAALTLQHQESISRQKQAEERASALEEELGRSASPSSIRDTESINEPKRRDSVQKRSNKEVQLAHARAIEAEKQLSESTQNFKDRLSQLEADYQSAVHYVKGTEKMLRRMKEELGKYKSANALLHERLEKSSAGPDQKTIENLTISHEVRSRELESRLAEIASEKELINAELSDVRTQLKTTTTLHANQVAQLESKIAHRSSPEDLAVDDAKVKQLEDDLSEAHLLAQRLEFENRELERRRNESEAQVKLILNQFEQSVDSCRRQSTLISSSMNGLVSSKESRSQYTVDHERDDHVAPSLFSDTTYQQRTSSALDLLANELDQLRGHLESSAKGASFTGEVTTPELTTSEFFNHERLEPN